jgi:hypothetical protein
MTPGTRNLVLLLRGVRGGLSVSTCNLPNVPTVSDHTLFSCRPGVGDAFMNLVEMVADFNNESDPRVCEWTTPVLSTLPDSGSRTCAAQLPENSGVCGSTHFPYSPVKSMLSYSPLKVSSTLEKSAIRTSRALCHASIAP